MNYRLNLIWWAFAILFLNSCGSVPKYKAKEVQDFSVKNRQTWPQLSLAEQSIRFGLFEDKESFQILAETSDPAPILKALDNGIGVLFDEDGKKSRSNGYILPVIPNDNIESKLLSPSESKREEAVLKFNQHFKSINAALEYGEDDAYVTLDKTGKEGLSINVYMTDECHMYVSIRLPKNLIGENVSNTSLCLFIPKFDTDGFKELNKKFEANRIKVGQNTHSSYLGTDWQQLYKDTQIWMIAE
ncbi:hypothetical protein [Sediminitomix flava]|uniref:Uncharacterized protein n=1 Tax=Sediminitomix flava TaxID=379075 RepID=A0A315ZYM7_SEDFL|nr:hypothetical protein [Sediminitomix flava]PWJ42467.1 hypothetical protein BC781_1028 [Sediminitomix flava]